MICIKIIKIVCITLLSICMLTQARSVSNYQMGDITITITDDKWQCDHIECPLDTFRCFVSKSNEEDPSILKRVNICYSEDSEILAENVSTSPIDPNNKIKQEINSTRNGVVSSSNNGWNQNFDSQKFNEDLNRDLTEMQTKLHSQMDDLHTNLNGMTERINANVQSQMQNLNKNLSNMRYNLAHMFN